MSDILRDASETKPLVDGQSAARGASESAHRRATAVATPAGAMSPDRVERRDAEGAEASERLEEGSPSRRGRNDEPSSTNVVAEHARDENDHHDETAHLKQLHALLRRSDAWRTHALVRLATSRGFVDAETRQSAWPRVLGICEIDKRAFRDAAARTHLDSSVVDADVERSLWAFTSAWRESDREATRAKLRRVIDGVVNVHGDEELDEDDDDANGGLKKKKPIRQKSRRVHYYQGFHDVCSVLLLNCGEKIACGVAERLAVFHLRDCTRPALAPLLDSLCLLDPLLESADETLHKHVFGEHWSTNDAFLADVFLRAFLLGTPNETEAETLARDGLRRCVFAVAWQMTWHVHGIGDLCGGVKNAPPPEEALPDDEKNTQGKKNEEHFFARRADAFRLRVASRLVDFFLTTHPAMPLYVGVEAMIRNRAYLLSVGRDEPAELHVALAKLRVAPDFCPTLGKERDDDDDATETAAFEALERSLLSARDLFRAYPPEEMYRRARVEPPPGCAHAKYPYPWLKNAKDDADANGETKKKKKSRFADDEAKDAETFKVSLARAPLPPEVFREDLDGVRTTNGDDGAWRRTPFRKRRALFLRSRIAETYERIVTNAAPPCIGAFCFFAVVSDLGSAERIERTVVFKVADVCTDPIFRELVWFVFVRGAYYHAARVTRYAGAVAKTVAAVVAVSVSIARGPFKLLSLKGVLATADRWLSAASHTVRFANASWYARSRVGGTSPRKIER